MSERKPDDGSRRSAELEQAFDDDRAIILADIGIIGNDGGIIVSDGISIANDIASIADDQTITSTYIGFITAYRSIYANGDAVFPDDTGISTDNAAVC